MGGVDGEGYFRELAEHSNSVLWMFTADFSELLFVNSAYERILGRPVDDLYEDPMDFMGAVHPADRDRVRSAVERVTGGEPVDLEFRVNEAEDYGRRVWVEGTPIRDDEGAFVRILGVARDVTERRGREAELERQVDRFEAIFETVPEPLVHVVFDDDRPVVRRVNPAFTEVFGYTTEEIEGRSINEVIVPEDRLEEARDIDERAQVGDTIEREVRRRAADGVRDFRFRVNWFEVVGEVREAIGAYVDISDQKGRQRELERQNERLEEFSSVVSHDLRNPLNVIQGRTQLARETGGAEHFDAIERSTERMATLIDDLLSLARAGATVQSFEPVALRPVVEGCWQNVETAEASLEVVEEATVYADESGLQQLLENLFSNAVRHGDGDVAVRVGTLEGGFYVEDDGPGVPVEDRETVFESGYTTEKDGIGYGLRIVRTIAEAHGWSVSLSTAETGGARFEVTGVRTA